MGATFPIARVRAISVSLLGPTTIDCRATGFLHAHDVRAAQAAIDTILSGSEETFGAVFDGRDIDAFEPGLPALWLKWALPVRHRFNRIAFVARTGTMLGIGRMFLYLIPDVGMGFYGDRYQAIEFVERQSVVQSEAK